MNDPLVNKYRKSFCGKNCRFCKYYKYVSFGVPFASDYYECMLRDKIINFPCRAKFCSYYTIEEK